MSARLSRLKSWLRSITHRNRVEAQMEDEILFHLEARAADLTQQGLSPREAMRRANGNKSEAACLLGLSRNALRYRLSKLGMPDEAE